MSSTSAIRGADVEAARGSVGWANAPLTLVAHARLADLLANASGPQIDGPLEASGVHVDDRGAHVVFDNSAVVARVALDLSWRSPDNVFLDVRHAVAGDDRIHGYEGVAWDPANDRWLLLVEAVKRSRSRHAAMVVEVRDDGRGARRRYLDVELPSGNKGMEGLACVTREGRTVLLALCEGNRCRSGRAGREPGGGRLLVFAETASDWELLHSIELPFGVAFTDYADVSISAGRIAVVSQASSAVWVGGFSADDLSISNAGMVYRFPLDEGRVCYCSAEGVAWLGPRLVTVTDEAGGDHPRRCRATEQSIQVWELPPL